MNTAARTMRQILPFSMIALAIVCAELWIVRSVYFHRNPDLVAVGMALDLTVVVPALFYFLFLRPRKKSPFLLIPFWGMCMAVAARMIPAENQDFLRSLKHFSPLLEVAVLAYLAARMRLFLRAYREAKSNAAYFTDALFAGFGKALSDRAVFHVIFTEFFLLYFAFAGWFLKSPHPVEGQQAFSYHRKSGYAAILAILMLVMGMETLAVHMIVSHWSLPAAWVLTVLSIYGVLWLIGDYHAIRVHPILVTPQFLHLRTGLRWRADIDRDRVADVVVGQPADRKAKDYLRASVLWPRAVVVLREPVEVEGLFGRRKIVSRIGVSVDDPDALRAALSR